MRLSVFKAYLTICLLFMLVSKVHSQARNQIFIGARPLGLGETFTAIADDGNAVYWNPAGLPKLKRMEFNSMYANLYSMPGMKNIYLSFVYPLAPQFAIGASYFNFGYDDPELEFFRDKVNISFGARTFGNLFLGANLKYVNTDTRLDGVSEGKAHGFGFDLGALFSLPIKNFFLEQIKLGVMAHDVRGTTISFLGTEKSEMVLPQNIRFGVALYSRNDRSILAFDVDDRFHAGTEFWLFENLAIRAGFQKDFNTNEKSTYSFGGSLKFPYLSVQMDYAYLIPPTLSPNHVFSLSFIPSMSPVKITEVNIDDLFASLYKSYSNRNIGNVTIRNDYDKELRMTLNVSIPGLSDVTTQDTIMLGPNQNKTFDFRAILSKTILNARGTDPRLVKIKVEYMIKNEKKTAEATKKFNLYGRGAIIWDDPRKAVAFITKLDRMVEHFVLKATSNLPYRPEYELGNIFTASALFDAMGAIGIKYQEDPDNPFSSVNNTHSVDYIKYPAELLKNKSGDCDDLTVLYASLLEYCGIKTALLSMPGHITLMFDTGIHERNWGLLPLGNSLVVIKDKSLWIPVEVTAVGKSFVSAWSEGGRKYREAEKDRDIQIVKVSDVEGIYLSALPDELQNQDLDLPDKGALAKLIAQDFKLIKQVTKKVIERYLVDLKKNPENLRLKNKLGIILAQQDLAQPAKSQFSQILQAEPKNSAALINLGNVQTIMGEYQDAEKSYLKAASLLSAEPGIALNLAILYQLWKYEALIDSNRLQGKSEEYLLQAFNLLKGDEIKALDMLGILAEEMELGEKADFKSDIKQKASAIKKFIKNNAAKYLLNKSIKGARVERMAVKRGIDNDRSYILWWADVKKANEK